MRAKKAQPRYDFRAISPLARRLPSSSPIGSTFYSRWGSLLHRGLGGGVEEAVEGSPGKYYGFDPCAADGEWEAKL
jgi:hypothetical protein